MSSQAQVRDLFSRHHGGPPTIVGAAPGRVNLIGEHTDYNGGLCLPLALTEATYAAASLRDDGLVRAVSSIDDTLVEIALDDIRPGHPDGWLAYAAGAVWSLRESGIPVTGLDLAVHSTVPLGAGLSSSAALECAAGVAVAALAGRELDDETRTAIRDAAMSAETDIVGAPTGGMDQTVAMLAEPGHALLLDFASRPASTRAVPYDPVALGAQLLVVDTRAAHSLADGQYARRRADCERAAALLGVATLREAGRDAVEGLADLMLRRRARHVVTEIARVRDAVGALETADAAALGRLMTRSHRSLAEDYEVSCPELDVAVETAMSSGALGARMTGGGFGGSAVVLAEPDVMPRIRRSVSQAYAKRRWRSPGFLDVEAGGPARTI